MSKSKTILTLFDKALNAYLKVSRELRASRNEARAIKRETRAEETHNMRKAYFGRYLPQQQNSTEEGKP